MKSEPLTQRSLLVRHGVLVFTGRLANVVVSAFSIFVVARILSVDEFGRYASVFAATQLLSLIAILGADQAVLRELGLRSSLQGEKALRPVIKAVATICVISMGLGVAVSVFCFLLFGQLLVSSPITPLMILGTVGYVIARGTVHVLGEACRAIDEPLFANFLGGMSSGPLGSMVHLILLAVAHQFATVTWSLAIWLYFLATLLPMALLLRKVASRYRDSPAPDAVAQTGLRTDIYEIFRATAVPFFLISVVAFFSARADVLILGFLRTPAEVADYEAARRLSMLLSLPLSFFNVIVVSSISKLHSLGSQGELERILRVTSALASIPSIIGSLLFFIAPDIFLNIFYGGQYESSAAVLKLLVPGQLLFALTGTCGLTLMHTGHGRVALVTSAVSAVLMLVIGTWAAQAYGGEGVAVVVSASVGISNMANWWLAKRMVGLWTHPDFSELWRLIGLGKLRFFREV